MTTKLREYETALDNLDRSKLGEVLEACRRQNPSLTTPSQLANIKCMRKISKITNMFEDLEGTQYPFATLYSADEVTTMQLSPYTYNSIYSQSTAGANGIASTVGEYDTDLARLTTSVSANADFETYHNATRNLYTDMKTTRKDLDNKMRSLYEDGYTENQTQYDNVVLVNLSWTVVATCVLYFLFVKL